PPVGGVGGGGGGKPRVRFGSGEVPEGAEDRWSGNPVMMRRMAEITANEQRFDAGTSADAELLIVAYGSVAQSVKAAVAELRSDGVAVDYFRPITLWPFPETPLRQRAQEVGRVLCVELNQGQMVEDVQAVVGGVASVHKLCGDGDVPAGFGKLWSPDAIASRAKEVLAVRDGEGR
ncbi:MAG TPA: transketolase C-terminal domain-containing protein, partial [Dehalococcoidia bacterium]|nr:transketolase C-terminal domain-containing protein [Dehalococcoidia bacterium]